MLPRRTRHTKVWVSQQYSDISRCQDHNSTDTWSTCAATNSQFNVTSMFPPATKSKTPGSGARTLTLPNSEQRSLCTSHLLLQTLSKTSTDSLGAELGTLILCSHHAAEKQHMLHRAVLIARQDGCLREQQEASKYGSQVCCVHSFCTKSWPIILIDRVYKNILQFKDDILQYNQWGKKVHLKMWSLAFETQHPF